MSHFLSRLLLSVAIPLVVICIYLGLESVLISYVDTTKEKKAHLYEQKATETKHRLEALRRGDEHAPDFEEFERSTGLLLARYHIDGDEIELITLPLRQAGLPLSPDETVQKMQQAFVLHEEIWHRFTTLIPATYRRDVVTFEIITDGDGRASGGLNRDPAHSGKFTLQIDLADAYQGDRLADAQLTYTLLHELGHMLSVAEDQVDRGEGDCLTVSIPDLGCMAKDAYLHQFIRRFWTDQMIHPPSFISAYAATSPMEDIAESFVSYVLDDQSPPDTVVREKIDFFSAYPELTTLRLQLRANI